MKAVKDGRHLDDTSVEDFIQESWYSVPEQEIAAASNPDTDSVHTPWRDQVYEFWNHVFYDVGKFLPEACPGQTCHRPPACDIFDHSIGSKEEGLLKVWDEALLLIPTFLEYGISIRTMIVPDKISQPTKAVKVAEQPL